MDIFSITSHWPRDPIDSGAGATLVQEGGKVA